MRLEGLGDLIGNRTRDFSDCSVVPGPPTLQQIGPVRMVSSPAKIEGTLNNGLCAKGAGLR
jgi:hypothetical protein